MAEFTFVNIQHQGATQPYATDVYMQLDRVSQREASEYQGANPYFLYRITTSWLPTINNVMLVQLGDLMIDTRVINPKTNALRQFRIISDPAPKTLLMKWSWVAEYMRGK